MHDPQGRRGLWAHVEANADASPTVPLKPLSIQMCAGREGDDAFVNIKLGDVVDTAMLQALADVIAVALFARFEPEGDPP